MHIKSLFTGLLVIASLSGCTTTAEFVNQNQPAATQAAQNRGKFELSCNEVSTTVLNSKTIDLFQTQVPEYQIGVSGCGNKDIYTVVCNPESGCIAHDNKTGVIDDLSGSGSEMGSRSNTSAY